jgi:xanthine dehydrogenase accessory factor
MSNSQTANALTIAEQWAVEGKAAALATVVETWGSAPLPAGSQMAVDATGNFCGSLSRGCIEGEIVAVAIEIIRSGAVSLAFHSGKSSKIEIDGRAYFLNVHLPPVKVVVIGAVRISQALAPMAALVGFDVTIIDPRGAFAVPGRFAEARLIVGWPKDELVADPYTALVAVAHDPEIDDFPIAAALRAGCFYVGALGSRRSHAARQQRLRADGVGDAALARIHVPIGLDIGAANPAEIAVAILAEIIQSLRRRTLSSSPDTA